MPVDPLHGRRIPSGRRLALALRDVLRGMAAASHRAVARGSVPDLSGFKPVLIRAVIPIILHEYHLGRTQARRLVKGARLRVKASFPFGGLPGPPQGVIGVDLNLLRDAVPDAVQRLLLDLAGITDTMEQEVRDAMESGLRAGASNAAIADSLPTLFGPRRAYTIAQTESSRAMHAGEEEYARDAGASGLEWLASSDACDGCLKLNGIRVRFGEPFTTLTSGNPAYRVVRHPPLHPRCMCTAVPWWE